MQRAATFLILLALAATARARVTFVAPLSGSQLFGPQSIEVTTDAKRVDRVDFFVDGVLAGAARTAPYRITFDFGDSLSARTISARVWTSGYHSSEVATVRTASLTANETLDVDLVEVPLRVRSSRPVKAADLRVRENGVVQTVREVRQERPPAHFAFVVDRSLSMGDGKLDAATRAIEIAVGQLRPGDTSSLVFFNHQVAKAVAVSSRPASLTPSGGTSLRDAVASIASRARTYAIVITDGGDRNSVLSDEEALRRISGTKTTVHAIVLGNSHAKFLDRAAANTGGRVVRASAGSVGTELRHVLEDINSRHLAVYQSTGTRRGWRTIEVKSSRVQIVTARKGYFAE